MDKCNKIQISDINADLPCWISELERANSQSLPLVVNTSSRVDVKT